MFEKLFDDLRDAREDQAKGFEFLSPRVLTDCGNRVYSIARVHARLLESPDRNLMEVRLIQLNGLEVSVGAVEEHSPHPRLAATLTFEGQELAHTSAPVPKDSLCDEVDEALARAERKERIEGVRRLLIEALNHHSDVIHSSTHSLLEWFLDSDLPVHELASRIRSLREMLWDAPVLQAKVAPMIENELDDSERLCTKFPDANRERLANLIRSSWSLSSLEVVDPYFAVLRRHETKGASRVRLQGSSSGFRPTDCPDAEHVFISYVGEDFARARMIEANLLQAGVKVWLDRNQIRPGRRWKASIRRAIREGAFFIACFSTNYLARSQTYMNEELVVAIEVLRERQMDSNWFIPVKLSPCEIPDRQIGAGDTLRDLHYVDLSADLEEGMKRILSVVTEGSLEQ